MSQEIILASSSAIRAAMLRQARVEAVVRPARIDEAALRSAMQAEGARARDIAAELAAQKARKVSAAHPQALVIGSDQILEHAGRIHSKAGTPEELRGQLDELAGQTHHLHAAAVICEAGRPVWRHVSSVALTMRRMSPGWLDDYVARNWPEIRHCVGGFMLEGEGIRLFSRIEGDWFSALGMPLLEVLDYLAERGAISS
jgi:septum formation protein